MNPECQYDTSTGFFCEARYALMWSDLAGPNIYHRELAIVKPSGTINHGKYKSQAEKIDILETHQLAKIASQLYKVTDNHVLKYMNIDVLDYTLFLIKIKPHKKLVAIGVLGGYIDFLVAVLNNIPNSEDVLKTLIVLDIDSFKKVITRVPKLHPTRTKQLLRLALDNPPEKHPLMKHTRDIANYLAIKK